MGPRKSDGLSGIGRLYYTGHVHASLILCFDKKLVIFYLHTCISRFFPVEKRVAEARIVGQCPSQGEGMGKVCM